MVFSNFVNNLVHRMQPTMATTCHHWCASPIASVPTSTRLPPVGAGHCYRLRDGVAVVLMKAICRVGGAAVENVGEARSLVLNSCSSQLLQKSKLMERGGHYISTVGTGIEEE